MIAITSLLDKFHSDRVSELTELLETKFGLNGVKVTPYPHLTILTAEIPDMEELKQYLELTCFEMPDFTIRTTGLGIFPGPTPVVYIPVLRTPPLNQLHAKLHRDISEMSSEMGVSITQICGCRILRSPSATPLPKCLGLYFLSCATITLTGK